jgi:protein-tyrosine phosphatase
MPGDELPFDLVVLCAKEYQLENTELRAEVFRCPLDDARPTTVEIGLISLASWLIAHRLRSGHRVLVTCFAGLNRSGVVSALALMRLGLAPGDAIGAVRLARGPKALSNPAFVELLRGFDPRRLVA